MRRLLVSLVVAVLAGCATDAAPTATSSPEGGPRSAAPSLVPELSERDAAWIADLERLVSARVSVHPDPWHGIDLATYQAAVDEAIARVPQLEDDELMVEVVRLAAMPTWAGRDGHGGILPWAEGSYPIQMLPLELYAFSDGVHVVDATAPYEELVGEPVIGLAGHPIDEVLAAVEPLVPRDNHQQLLTHGPRLALAVEVLHGLGLLADPAGSVSIEVPSGAVEVESVPLPEYDDWAGGYHAFSPPERPDGAAWVRRLGEEFWWEWRPDSATLYLQYNFVGYDYADHLETIQDRVDAGGVERLVLDLRHNPGGNNGVYDNLIDALLRAEAAGVRLYVIAGRATFSAAGNLAAEIEAVTDATFVGEDTGGSPNQYGDAVTFRLESGLVLRVAPEQVEVVDPADDRLTIEPDLPTPLSADDYFTDRDPAMEAILADS